MKATALVLTMMLILLATAVLADVPGLISYQGTLTDSNGVALNTIVTMTFTIYTDSTGGAQVWAENQPLVEVNNGLFNVLLGKVNALSAEVFSAPVRWLSVQVESDPELDPRQRIAAVGYAFRASVADTADFARAPAPSDGDWTISGNHIYSAVPGSVCIGAMIPDAKLHVVGGNVAVSDAGEATGIKIAESWITDPYDGALHIQSGGDVVAFDGSDDVGIGTSVPSAKLDVSGDINADSLYKIGGNTVLSVPDTHNVFVGVGAGANNTEDLGTFMGYDAGYNNEGFAGTFVGAQAGYSNQGLSNTFIGTAAGSHNTSGWENTFLGYSAGGDNTTGEWNTFLGSNAGLHNITGTGNTCVGREAGVFNYAGINNTYLGAFAGQHSNSDSNNVFVGYGAGSLGAGSDNVFIGTFAGAWTTTGYGNVFIGNEAGYHETGSNKLYIANSKDTSDVLIYGDFSTGNVGIGTLSPISKLHIKESSDPTYLTIESPDGYAPGVLFNVDGTNEWRMLYSPSDSMVSFWREYAGERMVIKNNGNVGIGTTNPIAKLDVTAVTDTTSIYGKHSGSGNYGYLGDDDNGVHGFHNSSSNEGKLGTSYAGVSGESYGNGTGVYGIAWTPGPSDLGVFGEHYSTNNRGLLGSSKYGVWGLHLYSNNYGCLGDSSCGVYAEGWGSYGNALYAYMDHTGTSPDAGYGMYVSFDCDTSGSNYLNSKSGIRSKSDFGSQNKNYLFAISGEQYSATPLRGGGVLGVYTSDRWGCLAYTSSGDNSYGAYFTSYGTGTGKTGVGFGSSAELLGGWISGQLYGLYISGDLYASYTDGNSFSNGYEAALHDVGDQKRVASYTATSLDVELYAHGTASLDKGFCSVLFEEDFRRIISSEIPMTVTVTPMGPCQQLYLASVNKGGFEVRESGEGKSSVTFSWIAIGRRKGFESRPEIPTELAASDFDTNMRDFAFNEGNLDDQARPMWHDGTALRWDTPQPSPIPVEKRRQMEKEKEAREKRQREQREMLAAQDKTRELARRSQDLREKPIPQKSLKRNR